MTCGNSADQDAEVLEPRMPTAADEVKTSAMMMHLVFALARATEIRAVVDNREDAHAGGRGLESRRYRPLGAVSSLVGEGSPGSRLALLA